MDKVGSLICAACIKKSKRLTAIADLGGGVEHGYADKLEKLGYGVGRYRAGAAASCFCSLFCRKFRSALPKEG